jgi:hypothetical protein
VSEPELRDQAAAGPVVNPVEIGFLPADPPRAGRIVAYRVDGTAPLPDDGTPATVLIASAVTGRIAEVEAILLAPRQGVPELLGGRWLSTSGRIWHLAGRKALEAVARGAIVPGLDGQRQAAWRIAGLTGADDTWLHQLADAMPLGAYAIADEHGRLPDRYRLLRAFLDAVADTWARGAAATRATGEHPFSLDTDTPMPEFGWAAEQLAHGRDDGLGIALMLDAGGYSPKLRASWYDRSQPAQLVSAEEAGDRAPDLRHQLAAIGRALRWPVLIDAPSRYWGPVEFYLDEGALEYLLADGGVAALREQGVDVRVPRPIEREITTVLTIADIADPEAPAGEAARTPAYRWTAKAADRVLTADDFDQITESHSSLVDLGDRWLLVDQATRRRLRARAERPAPMDALRAALTGSARIAGDDVPVAAVEGALAALRDRLRRVADPEPASHPAGLAAELRDYQRRGLAWLSGLAELGFGACLADDMGLGKTVQLIAHHLARQADPATAGPTLVVAPASLVANWEAEIRRFAPGTAVRRFHGPDRDLNDVGAGEFVLTTYGTLRRDIDRLAALKWGLACADEAQAVKNPGSAAAKALRRIGTGSRVALTGTPVENHLGELWAILDWCTPGLLGTQKAFRDAYGRGAERGDAQAAARLRALVRPFILRRLKTDPEVAPELPGKTVTDEHVVLSAEQARLYERVVAETMDAVRSADGIERRGRILAMLTRLKQVCNHPAHYAGPSDPAESRSGKLDLLDDLLATITAEGEHALIFTQFVQMGRLLERHLGDRGIDNAFLHGQTRIDRRERIVADFQSGDLAVLVLSLKAAGTGLNLTRATHVIHYDQWWNPAVEDQASDRAHRIGQARPVQIHRLICEGTLEERIRALADRKRDLAQAIVGPSEAALTELTDDQLLDLIRLERR